MNTSSSIQTPMNATQMMLLRLFSRPVPEQRMKEIKKLLLQYYTQNLHDEVEKAIAEKGITDADYEALENKSYRNR